MNNSVSRQPNPIFIVVIAASVAACFSSDGAEESKDTGGASASGNGQDVDGPRFSRIDGTLFRYSPGIGDNLFDCAEEYLLAGETTGDLQWDVTLTNITNSPAATGVAYNDCTGMDFSGTLRFENDRVYFRESYIGTIRYSAYYFGGFQQYAWGTNDFVSGYGGEVWTYYTLATATFTR